MRCDGIEEKRSAWCLIAIFLVALGLAGAAKAGLGQAAEVAAPLVATPIAPPNPVTGSDGKIHLAYEFVLMNMAPGAISLEKIETLDAESGAVIGTLEGVGLEKMVRLNGGAKGTSVAAGGSGFVFMDVTLAKEATLPKALRHRFTISVTKAPGEPASGDHDPVPAPPEQLTFVTDPLSVGPAPPSSSLHRSKVRAG
jgi:hypothetical protein